MLCWPVRCSCTGKPIGILDVVLEEFGAVRDDDINVGREHLPAFAIARGVTARFELPLCSTAEARDTAAACHQMEINIGYNADRSAQSPLRPRFICSGTVDTSHAIRSYGEHSSRLV